VAKTQDLISKAQQRGINMSEDAEGAWHGSFVHDGQEYTLDNETVEGLADDMNALVDILSEDDTYTIDYNEDADRYVIGVNGFATPFTDQVLAKAFEAAREALNEKMRKDEEARKAREPKPAATKPTKANGPKSDTASSPSAQAAGSAIAVGDLPLPISDAVVRLINALTDLIAGAGNKMARDQQGEGFVAAGAESPPPAKPSRKRGLNKS
jgi:hypothetical protein